jgi:acetyl-CoA C-acetyltransferase
MGGSAACSRSSAVIVSLARTPIAKFCGSYSSLTAPQLGSIAIKGALSKLPEASLHNFTDLSVEEAYMGNVISAGIGQAPCRQAVLGAGLPHSTICTTVNKVCASGMKATMMAAQAIGAGSNSTFLTGGMESMTNAPHYATKARMGTKLGSAALLDGVIHDGLWDVYNNQHMGMCGEKCAADYNISREQQDEYAIESYKRAQDAIQNDKFAGEIVPVEIPSKKKGADPVRIFRDEEPGDVDFGKLKTVRPAFQPKGGTVTAANSSSLNDGAAALVVMSEARAQEMGLEPLAKIRGYGDAARLPEDFTTAPSLAIPVALQHAGILLGDIEYHEINEAFSVVALANMQLLDLDHAKVNAFGGAVALGHPIGASGARLLCTLYSVLKDKDATLGCASICNGGGGASALIIERLK